VGRRHALHAALAAVAGAVGAGLLRGADPVRGANGDTITVGGSFTGTSPTTITNSSSGDAVTGTQGTANAASAGVRGVSGADGNGVIGESFGGTASFGVWARTDIGYGVFASASAGVAVNGTNNSSNSTIIGFNEGSGPGVSGRSTSGTGVLGQSTNGSGNTNVGVYGQAMGSSGGIGVLGLCSNDINSVGVYAQSATGKGFLGFSNATAGVGAVGVNSTSGIGLYGSSAGGFGIVSSGNLYVTGTMTVTGAKSAAVRDAGGKLRRMYSLESPESWFEDFGSGQLSGGSATVTLEPGFAGVVRSDGYRVFPVPKGDCKGLYVNNLTSGGFSVHELQGGTSSVAFDYRVVARRKDIAGARLEPVDEPKLPDVPSEPITPEPMPEPAQKQRRG
jgi:hypothetical protein